MNRPRILLVDDMPEVIDYCIELLKPHCDVVGVAKNGTAAISAFAELQPDVIVLDISMPGMNGIEVAKSLRYSGCRAVIVFFSADDGLVPAALDAGGSAFVTKTRAGSDLPLAISEALAGRPFVSRYIHVDAGNESTKL